MESSHRRRISLIQRRMVQTGADGLLITHLPNIFYLSGFSGSSGALLIQPGRVTLFTDGRYSIQAQQEARSVRVRTCRGHLSAAIGEHLGGARKLRIAFEAARLSVSQMGELRRLAGSRIRWLALENVVEELRSVKEAAEVSRMRRTARLGCEVLREILPLVKPGVRELELAAEIDYRMRRKGASGAAFETIVASGFRTALPHARPTKKKIQKNELVVLDLGAILAHYCCDLTRTVYVGRAPAKIRGWYEGVREAQAAALNALRVGVATGEVDAAARRVLQQLGLAHCFLHSTGHGLGLEVHEEPRLAKGQTRPIQAGNVVSLEPGVYVEGIGGIRIEDDVAVLPAGSKVLTTAPREFLEL